MLNNTNMYKAFTSTQNSCIWDHLSLHPYPGVAHVQVHECICTASPQNLWRQTFCTHQAPGLPSYTFTFADLGSNTTWTSADMSFGFKSLTWTRCSVVHNTICDHSLYFVVEHLGSRWPDGFGVKPVKRSRCCYWCY